MSNPIKEKVSKMEIIKDRIQKLSSGCWSYHNLKSRPTFQGYYIYRLMFEDKYGKIPEGSICCHKCDNQWCVNPEHIFIGTHKENFQDMVNKIKKIGRDKYKAKSQNINTDFQLWMKRMGLTIAKFAEETGSSYHSVVKWLYGTKPRHASQLVIRARFPDCPLIK